MMDIPGSQVLRSIITPECRKTRGNDGAFDESVRRARQIYDQYVDSEGEIPGTEYNLILTVDPKLPPEDDA